MRFSNMPIRANDLSGKAVSKLIRLALEEDIGPGDLTGRLTVRDVTQATGLIRMKKTGVVAGLPVAEQVFIAVDPGIRFRALVRDGARVRRGGVVAEVKGKARSLLAAERTALNFLQRLSGIATLTREFVSRVAGTGVGVLDTRKTTPGLRLLEKYAVRVGGGLNHRMGLYDGVLIKANHLRAAGLSLAGGIRELERVVKAATRGSRPGRPVPVEVEARTVSDATAAARLGAGIIMFDNMSIGRMKRAVRKVRSLRGRRVLLEASGGVSLDNIRKIADAGVDFISVGMLTHSAPALDMNMEIRRR